MFILFPFILFRVGCEMHLVWFAHMMCSGSTLVPEKPSSHRTPIIFLIRSEVVSADLMFWPDDKTPNFLVSCKFILQSIRSSCSLFLSTYLETDYQSTFVFLVWQTSHRYNEDKTFRLTSVGMDTISSCKQRGFHPHETRGLFEECTHVKMDADAPLVVKDFRL